MGSFAFELYYGSVVMGKMCAGDDDCSALIRAVPEVSFGVSLSS